MRLATLLTILIAGAASAKTPPPTFTVCASGCDFSMIQDAVAAAVSGTTIDVGPGTYAENVTVNAVTSPKKLRLTIEGAGAASTIVDGSGASSVFTVVGSKAIVTLRGMTIRDGLAPGTGTGAPTEGGGVFAGLGAAVTIDACVVSDNHADLGAGVAADDAQLSISLSTIADNISIGAVYVPEGGGVFFSSTKHRKLVIAGSIISNNVASYGAGLDISSNGTRLLTSDATIAGTTISFNDAAIPQGSVPVSTQGGGIFVLAAKLAVTNTTISNNTSVGPGGQTAAIGNHQGEVTLNNVTITDNTAVGFTGGIEAGARTTLSNTILSDNGDASGESDCSGELVSKDYNVVLDTKCTFSGQTAHDIIGSDPMLAPLADNGGTPAPLTPPQTRAPMGRLILGAGNPATPNGKSGHCEPEDETGLPGHEHVVGRCDVGAYQTPPG